MREFNINNMLYRSVLVMFNELKFYLGFKGHIDG